ncbi:MAG TPA: hypothetical protein VJN70_00150 [Gemmatimonadaceae bacterium]|nr:hypothetical protein [Gemmatimonadaceae bacterium]
MSMLSSRWTYTLKFVYAPFCMIAMGAFLVFGASGFRGAHGESPPPLFPWIFGAVWFIAGVGILRFAIPLKRVELRDDRLYVSNFRREWEVRPTDILSVRQRRWVNGRPIRVQLRRDLEGLGSGFVFIPPRRAMFKFWREDPQVDELRRYAEGVRSLARA